MSAASGASALPPPRPETFNYVVSASKETVIDHCVSGCFTSEDSIDVICSKETRVEVRTLSEKYEKLDFVASQPVFGRITSLKLIKNPISTLGSSSNKDWLFVLTDRPHFYLFSFDGGKLVEKAFGDLGEVLSKMVHTPLVAVDPKSKFILCHIFLGLLSVILLDARTGLVKEKTIASLEELKVLDMCLLSSQSSRLCLLYEDNNANRHVKTYDVKNLREMHPGPWSQPNVDASCNMIVPSVDGSVLLFSANTVVHMRENPNTLSSSSGSAVQQPTAPQIITISVHFGRAEAVGLFVCI